MGVVNNEIRIAGLEANTAGIMNSVADCAEALNTTITSVNSLKTTVGDNSSGLVKAVNDIKTSSSLTVTAADNVTIHEQNIHKINNIVVGYVRFTVSVDMPATTDYEIFSLPDDAPSAIMRFVAAKEWGATGVASIALNENGHFRTVSSTLAKGSAYSIFFAFTDKTT